MDMPVVFGNALSITLGNSSLTSPSIEFIILALNCSDETYLYVKKPPPRMPNIRIPVTMVIMSKAFRMIKYQIIRACSLMSLFVLLLIVAISPLYVTMGLMMRELETHKTN